MKTGKQDTAKQFLRICIALCFIFVAAALRVLPHPWNFTPIGAMALFSGAKLGRGSTAFFFPLAALFLSDLMIGVYPFLFIVYASFCISVIIGTWFHRRQTILPLSMAILLGSGQFFLVSNFAVWAFGHTLYTKSFAGLLACYAAGIPFLGNTLAGDAFYGLVLFGGFALAERLSPALRHPESSRAS